jgi:hypothetical protein
MVYYTQSVLAAEDVLRSVLEQDISLTVNPVAFYGKFIVGGFIDATMAHRAVPGLLLGRDGIRIVPEVKSVNIAEVKPEADVMWMVNALVRARVAWEASRYYGSVSGAERVQSRFFKVFGVNVRGEQFAVVQHIYLAGSLVRFELNDGVFCPAARH